MQNKLKNLVFFLLMLFASWAYALDGEVVRVIDGDTIDIVDRSNGNQLYRIRLAHIDAPERGQAFSNKARERLAELVFRKPVYIDVYQPTDKYNRVLGVVYLGNVNVNKVLVQEGLAWAYRYHGVPSNSEYAEIEAIAKQSRLGLWIDSHPIEPFRFRRGQRS